MAADTLRHPTLNRTLRGKPATSTIQFRNLKYATIPGRWEDPILNDELSDHVDDIYDATEFGPSCPHRRGAQAFDLTVTGNVKMPMEEGKEELMDEFSCLTVNVSIPKSHLDESTRQREKLPVFVWVHGGGLSFGSNNWPQYNVTRFVERSCEIGKPVIGVGIHYRIGIFGYLASTELGIDGNFGYKDQVAAFRWIKKHIAGFGGDPKNITASGESAGGTSLSTLLCVDVGQEGLFEKVVIMSGEATLRKPRIKSWHDQMYKDQLEMLGLENTDVEERRKKLREMSVEELVNKLPLGQQYSACIDGKFLKQNVSLDVMANGASEVHKPAWCKDFVIGDVRHDGTILHSRVIADPEVSENLKASCALHLSGPETAALLSAYNLPASSSEQQIRNLTELITDLRFYMPILASSLGWKAAFPLDRSHRYHFHVPNPVEGQFTHFVSHELDVAFLLQNYFDHLDENSRRVATQMTDHWIKYVNGEPWGEVGKILVIGTEGLTTVDETAYDDKFRGGVGKVLQMIGAERCYRVGETWQGVRVEETQPAHLQGGSRRNVRNVVLN